MKKYKSYKSKRTKYHPSIHINVLEDVTWENIEIKIDVYVSLIKEQRKNGGKLTTEALTHEGHTPSTAIKAREKKKGKKNE